MGALLRLQAVVLARLQFLTLGLLIISFRASLASAKPTGSSGEKLEQEFHRTHLQPYLSCRSEIAIHPQFTELTFNRSVDRQTEYHAHPAK
jgi:hypothetical protein